MGFLYEFTYGKNEFTYCKNKIEIGFPYKFTYYKNKIDGNSTFFL
jgi:hypothetical protein